jgi:hypothetical protein
MSPVPPLVTYAKRPSFVTTVQHAAVRMLGTSGEIVCTCAPSRRYDDAPLAPAASETTNVPR